MAFTRATRAAGQFTEKLTDRYRGSRAVRAGAGLVGAATLVTTGVAGTFATPATADQGEAPRTYALGVVQAMAVGDTLAHDARDQAEAQQHAAGAVQDGRPKGEEQRAAAQAAEQRTQERAAKTRIAEERAAKERAAKERAAEKARAAKERAAARAGRSAERTGVNGAVPPVRGVHHTTPYKVSGNSWSSGKHSGIDFPVVTGTPVRSVSAGTVVTAGWGGAYGNQIVIRHHDGRHTQYGHLSSLGVSPGQSVAAGQRIGLSGSTGNSTGPHLHFEARTGAFYGSDIDPVAYLRSQGIAD
ncbi:MAG TPA: M23 family metallopeptidase [Streptomyces sp.]|nr:M23 family metallopeptidase [Streptomyces sp.]